MQQSKRVADWIELGFWQLVVKLLSGARPFSGLISKAAIYVEEHPLPRRWPLDGLVALLGWACGLALGLWLARAYF